MDLPGWAPQPGGSTKPGDVFPNSTDDVTIENVIRYANEHLMFTCMFRGASVFYDFPMLDEKTANKVAAILNDHVGQTLTSIAFVEISEGEA
jgi:hypothetical protein